MTLSRRQLLTHFATGIGVLAVSGCRGRDLTPLIDALVDLAITRDSLSAIGEAYLSDREGLPEQGASSIEALAERLAIDLDWSVDQTRHELSDRLVRRIRSDFRDSKTVRVRGWLLSETEARWAALVALAPAGREG